MQNYNDSLWFGVYFLFSKVQWLLEKVWKSFNHLSNKREFIVIWLLQTSSISVTQVGKPPDVSKTHGKTETRKKEFNGVVPFSSFITNSTDSAAIITVVTMVFTGSRIRIWGDDATTTDILVKENYH